MSISSFPRSQGKAAGSQRTGVRPWLTAAGARWGDFGLQGKMLLVVLIGLLGLIGIFGFLSISTSTRAIEQLLSERVMMAQMTASRLGESLGHLDESLAILAREASLAPAAREREATLRTGMIELGRAAKALYLFDAGGTLLLRTGPAQASVDWGDLLAAARAGTGLQLLPGGDQRAILLTASGASGGPHAAGGTMYVAALLDLDAAGVSPFERGYNVGRTGHLEVVDAQGRVVVAATGTDRHTALPPEFLGPLFENPQPRTLTCSGCTGGDVEPRDVVVAFARAGDSPWAVVVRQDADELFAPVNNLTLITALLGVISMAGALTLVGALMRGIVEPIRMLTDAAARIAAGDMNTPIGWQRNDEVGHLALSFDAMRARLAQSTAQTSALNRQLDARVQQRTLEAQRLNDDLRTTIDGLSDCLLVIGRNYTVQRANRAACEAMEQDPCRDGTPELRCYRIFGADRPCEDAGFACPMPDVVQTRTPVKVTQRRIDRVTGAVRFIEVLASPMLGPDGDVERVVELLRDVTEEKRTEESLLRRNQQLAIINAVATTVNQSLDISEILQQTLDKVLRLTGVDVGAVFVRDETDGSLDMVALRGITEETARKVVQFGMLDNSCGGVLQNHTVIVVPGLALYRGRRARSLQQEGLRTLVHVPLLSRGSALGSMCVGTRLEREFNAEEQELLQAIGSQIAVAIENSRLYTELAHKERMRGELLRKVITAQEEERKRIARELHDDTSQAITALLYATEEAAQVQTLEEVGEMLEAMRSLAQGTLDGVHQMIFDLRPSMLDHLGLVPALRWFARSRLEPSGIQVTIEESTPPRRLPAEAETALFRAIQEAINNVARHSNARRVRIVFDFDADAAGILVEDDGVGFDPVEMALHSEGGRGLGLMGMHERVSLLGGDVEVSSVPGSGTVVRIQLPLVSEEAPA